MVTNGLSSSQSTAIARVLPDELSGPPRILDLWIFVQSSQIRVPGVFSKDSFSEAAKRGWVEKLDIEKKQGYPV